MSRSLRNLLLMVVFGVCLTTPSPSSAEEFSDWRKCGDPDSIATGPELSLYMAVYPGQCNQGEPPFIVKLKPDGTIDQSFGSGGRLIPSEVGVTEFPFTIYGQNDPASSQSRKLLIADQKGITRINPDGSIDSTFGSDGRLEFPPSMKQNPRLLWVNQDGSLDVAGEGQTSGSFAVGQFTAVGAPELGFGSGGIQELDLSGQPYAPTRIEAVRRVPDTDKVTVAVGYARPNPDFVQPDDGIYLMRLTSAGDPDPSYGNAGTGVLDLLPFINCPPDCRFVSAGVTAMMTQPDGSLTLVGNKLTFTYSQGDYDQFSGIRLSVNSSGTGLGTDSRQDLDFFARGILPGGDIYGSPQVGPPYNPPSGSEYVYKTDSLGTGAFPEGRELTRIRVAPGLWERVPLLVAGSNAFFVAGKANGVVCGPLDYCYRDERIFVAKIDADDGVPDESFGTNGSAVLGKVCYRGKDTHRTIMGWPSCRLPKVDLAAKSRLKKRFTNRPSMTVRAVLSEFGGLPNGSVVRVRAKLPEGVVLTRKAARRIAVETNAKLWYKWEEPKYQVQAKGRNLTVKYRMPGEASDWQGGPETWKFRVKVDLKPGALKSIDRGNRRGKKYVSVDAAIDTRAGAKWYVGSSDQSSVVARR